MPDNPLIVPNSVTASFQDVVMSLGDIAYDVTIKALRVGDGATAGGRIFYDQAGQAELIALSAPFVIVATVEARDAIPTKYRRAGLRVSVLGNDGTGTAGRVFILGGDLSNSGWSGQPSSAELLNRANQTGTQSADTIVDGSVNATFPKSLKTALSPLSQTITTVLGSSDRTASGTVTGGNALLVAVAPNDGVVNSIRAAIARAGSASAIVVRGTSVVSCNVFSIPSAGADIALSASDFGTINVLAGDEIYLSADSTGTAGAQFYIKTLTGTPAYYLPGVVTPSVGFTVGAKTARADSIWAISCSIQQQVLQVPRTNINATDAANLAVVAAQVGPISQLTKLAPTTVSTVGVADMTAGGSAVVGFALFVGAAASDGVLSGLSFVVATVGSGAANLIIARAGTVRSITPITVTATGAATFTGAQLGSPSLLAGDEIYLHSLNSGVSFSKKTSAGITSYGFGAGTTAPAVGSAVSKSSFSGTVWQINFQVTFSGFAIPRTAMNPVDMANLGIIDANAAGIAALPQIYGSVYSDPIGYADPTVAGTAITGGFALLIGQATAAGNISALNAVIFSVGNGAANVVVVRAGIIISISPVTYATTGFVSLTGAALGTIPVQAGDAVYLQFLSGGISLYRAAVTGATSYYFTGAPVIGASVTNSTSTGVYWRASFITVASKFQVGPQNITADIAAALSAVSTDSVHDISVKGSALASTNLVTPATWNGLIYYGESLSTGVTPYGPTAVSLTQPNFNLTFGAGPKASKAGNAFGGINIGTDTVKALVEDTLTGADNNGGGGTEGETMCSGAANGAAEYAALYLGVPTANFVIFSSTAGHGGYKWLQLQKGAAWYQNLKDHVSEAAARAAAAGKTYVIHAVVLVLGHNDATAYNTATATIATARAGFLASSLQFVADINTDLPPLVNAVMSAAGLALQTTKVHLLMSQLGSLGTTNGGKGVMLAQMDAAAQSPLIHLTGPRWDKDYVQNGNTDGTHMSALGYQKQGQIDGRAYAQLVQDGRNPDVLWPLSVTIRGTSLIARFRVPRTPLVLDTVNYGLTNQFGFRLFDTGGDIAMSNITAQGSTVAATLARATSNGAVPTLNFALDYLAAGKATAGNPATGNLRDSSTHGYYEGGVFVPLWHVSPSFQLLASVLSEA